MEFYGFLESLEMFESLGGVFIDLFPKMKIKTSLDAYFIPIFYISDCLMTDDWY